MLRTFFFTDNIEEIDYEAEKNIFEFSTSAPSLEEFFSNEKINFTPINPRIVGKAILFDNDNDTIDYLDEAFSQMFDLEIVKTQATFLSRELFSLCTGLKAAYLPQATDRDEGIFINCNALRILKMPKFAPADPLNHDMFLFVSGIEINVTLPAEMQTANDGELEGDFAYLLIENTANFTFV